MPAAKTKGKSSGNFSTGGLNKPLKMVKMLAPRCQECNPRGQGKRGWQETCEHDPYHSMQPKGPPKPKFEEQPDGSFKQVGEEEQLYIKRPNWEQVPDDAKVSSARSVTIARERGAKFPEELGYAPICDYFNCWEVNPSFHAKQIVAHEGTQVVVGNYHTRDEAAIMTLRLTGTPIFIGIDEDIQRRRKQLNEVNIL
jgi:hypothetical protein